MRPTITQRLAAEPAALGTLVASVLPAFVALGVLVVAINALTGFGIRLFVAPLPTATATATAAAAAE